MKIVASFLLTLLLCIGVAFAAPSHTGPPANTPVADKAIQAHSAVGVSTVTAVDIALFVTPREDPVKTQVGSHLALEDWRYIADPVVELDGYAAVEAKPKITTYNGLGHEHYARADV